MFFAHGQGVDWVNIVGFRLLKRHVSNLLIISEHTLSNGFMAQLINIPQATLSQIVVDCRELQRLHPAKVLWLWVNSLLTFFHYRIDNISGGGGEPI